ncbi:MAG: hypothetical protein KC457_23665, partial [Myxococcales bacterium]|nr:hypothetical protein [Myxococcales bacterium]
MPAPGLALIPSLPMLPMGGSYGSWVTGLWVLPIAASIFAVLTLGKLFSRDCAWKQDDQIGLKLIIATLLMIGTGLFASGLQGLLHL